MLDLVVAQFLTGLASASSLFLVASGLSLVFGVTRVVNFAHGAFYMLGAYAAVTLTERWSGPAGFWAGLLAAAAAVAAVGALVEIAVLRRIYRSPELFQLLATFGLTLVAEDLVVQVWGPEDLLGPRAPGLRGAVLVLGQPVPAYDLVLIGIGPAVLLALWLLLTRTRWGVLVRAATGDREMVAALGIDERRLFTGVFALGVFLAALGGALQVPRAAASHGMDLAIIVEVFVVVVIGGLGSIGGAFLAAILVAELNAFGILVLPKVSLVVAFAAMAVVLVLRPRGLLGRASDEPRTAIGRSGRVWAPLGRRGRAGVAAGLAVLAALPFVVDPYLLTVGAEIAVAVLFAASLQFLLSTGGLVSFGHALPFGLGAYGAAFGAKLLGLPMGASLGLGAACAAAGTALLAPLCLRLSGVYLAMLTLAFAQIAWSVAFQWVDVTGGDNGILGVWPAGWASRPAGFYWLALGIAACGVAALRIVTFSPFGYALRALRDSEGRAASLGLRRRPLQAGALALAGAGAGLAGALFAFLKGSVFPDAFGVAVSVDGLVAVLLGGVGTVSGAVVGAAVYKALSIWLVSVTDLSKLWLGLFVVGLVVTLPDGLVGAWARRAARGGQP